VKKKSFSRSRRDFGAVKARIRSVAADSIHLAQATTRPAIKCFTTEAGL
jgi:hypothetical protein